MANPRREKKRLSAIIDQIGDATTVMQYKGSWNASTNTPTLADSTGNTGDTYRISVAGTQNLGSGSLAYSPGDLVIHNGTIWERAPSADIGVAAQNRYVAKHGNDSTGDGSLEHPYLTISAAETAITDNSSSFPYVLHIGPGSYTLSAGYAKKPNIHWIGTGRLADTGTVVSLSGGSGGMTIAPTASADSVNFTNIGFTTSTGGIIVNATGYKSATAQVTTALTLRFFFCNLSFGTANQVTFNGTDPNSNTLYLFGCTLGNGASVKSCSLVAYFTYFSGTIVVTENASQPETPTSVIANTTKGSATVTLVGGNTYGLVGGLRIAGTGVIPGAVTAGNTPTTTLLLDKPATLTQSGVTLTVTARRDSSCQLFHCRTNGVTISKYGQGQLFDGSSNAGSFTLSDAGSIALATAEMLRNTVTVAAGTYLTYASTVVKGERYVPTTPANWNATVFTVTIATPAVFTKVTHGLVQGQSLMFHTTIALPTGLSAGTVYYAYPIDADTFMVSTSASFTSLVTTTGSQSGVHSYTTIPETLLLAVDSLASAKLAKAGDTMTGLLVLSADPGAALGAATKQYVDGKILTYDSAAGSGGSGSEAMTVTGLLSTDTILSVSQKTPGANSTAVIGWASQADNALTVSWTANPGAGAVIRVAVKR